MTLFSKVPAEPTPNLVVVNNIASTSSEKTVKDFFLFCGRIKDFELQKDESGEHQVALVYFDRESAAKTAILLTNAVIDDSHITVEPYFKDAVPQGVDEPVTPTGQEGKSVTNIIAEILAAGYTIQDHIIASGLAYDAKYHFSTTFQSYLATILENLKAVDEKYRVTDKVSEIDAKFHIQEKAQSAAQQAQTTAQNALATPTGQRVQEIATQTIAQIAAVHAEAKRIAAEKKAKEDASHANATTAEVATQ